MAGIEQSYLQVERWMESKYAVSAKDISRRFRMSYRQAQRYLHRMYALGVIYKRYRQRFMFYSLTKYRRDDEPSKAGRRA